MISEARDKMQQSLDHLKGELAKLHTGRANPGLIEELQVEAYDSKMRLMEVAAISAPQSNLLVIQPWDQSVKNNIVRAVEMANLGMNPQIDGEVIRIVIPPLSQERRQQLVKLMHSELEEARVAIRKIRQDERDALLRAEKDHTISEDDSDRQQKDLQKVTDEYIEKIDAIGRAKEGELMQV